MTQIKSAAHRHRANKISAKHVRSCLSVLAVVIVQIYVFNLQWIAHLHRMDIENATGPLQAISLQEVSQTSPIAGCALTILYYYINASLMWSAVIFWIKRRRKLALIISAACVVINCVQLYGNCEMAEESSFLVSKSGGLAWSESYSPKKFMDDNIRISFRLHDPKDVPYPDKFVGVPGYRCTDGPDLADLPPTLSGRTILNFTTTIATDLKIVFIGDSISEQFAAAFDAAVLGPGYEGNRLAQTYINGHGGINTHTCLSVAAPVRGGGVSSFWRIAALISMSTWAGEYICEHKSRTWNEGAAQTILDHQYSDSKELAKRKFPPAKGINKTSGLPNTVGAFDVIVLRLNHGWLTIAELTKERIVEAINLSKMNLGARTIIISTLPLNNNVLAPSDWEGVAKINQMVRDIARNWVPKEPGSAEWVLVQEFGNFTNQVLRMNAEHIKLTNSSTPDFSQKEWELGGTDFLLKRLSAATYWYPSIAMVCAEQTFPTINDKKKKVDECIRNKISRDGCHWCADTIGPRYSASVACLLGCVHNGREPSFVEDMGMVRQCERSCNERFMSILPVEKKWIDNQMALFSKSF
eukprot:CAMPEP_0183734918 /NCGR_PEP_ID=MMETSP0737-20130205/45159_1 /TAXON_ID=385413 /ORGANISM="Thalassiosira miniscula, Strain CCMP1093" /LENGTH=582 /DNA_ID=CAMNT_0025968537 /DNA_START=140 /DNA_END=1888 /DNA_ORIENTATION=+